MTKLSTTAILSTAKELQIVRIYLFGSYHLKLNINFVWPNSEAEP